MASPISHLIAFWEWDMHAALVLDWKTSGSKANMFRRDNRAGGGLATRRFHLPAWKVFHLQLKTTAWNVHHLFLANDQQDYLLRRRHDHGTKGKARWQHLRWQTNCVSVESRTKCVSPVIQMDLACAWPVNNHSTLHKLLQASAGDPWGKPPSSALSPGNEHSVLLEQREQRATGLGRFLKYHLGVHACSVSSGA